jgi:hypothetical protein
MKHLKTLLLLLGAAAVPASIHAMQCGNAGWIHISYSSEGWSCTKVDRISGTISDVPIEAGLAWCGFVA